MNDAILRGFADNQLVFDAVKDVILKQFTIDDLPGLQGLDDKQLGEVIRARINGKLKVETAFQVMATYKTPVEQKPITNQAR